MQEKPKFRYRLTFSKSRPVKYVAHLDSVLTWTRAFRRANIPLAYSEGFNPQARIQVVASLPIGYIGRAEIMDIFLQKPMPSGQLLSTVGATLPPGFGLLSVAQIPAKSATLQKHLCQAKYQVTVETNLSLHTLNQRINNLLAADEIMTSRIRRKKKEFYNLRPLLHELSTTALLDGDIQLFMQLSAGQNGNLRPDAVMQALGLGNSWFEVERTQLLFDI